MDFCVQADEAEVGSQAGEQTAQVQIHPENDVQRTDWTVRSQVFGKASHLQL